MDSGSDGIVKRDLQPMSSNLAWPRAWPVDADRAQERGTDGGGDRAGVKYQQRINHSFGNAPWSDAAMLAKVSDLVFPAIERSGQLRQGSSTSSDSDGWVDGLHPEQDPHYSAASGISGPARSSST
jgi:hypothetical protein